MPADENSRAAARILSRKRLYSGWLAVERLTVARPGADRPADYEVHDHGDGAAVLPYDPRRRVAILVRQIRAGALVRGIATPILEVPAGLIDAADAGPEATARRELAEETGLTAGALEPLGAVFSSPGSLAERVFLFLAAVDMAADAAPRPQDGELIEVVPTPLAELKRLVEAGGIIDAKTVLLALALRVRRPELFA